jgi:hypothetical protein
MNDKNKNNSVFACCCRMKLFFMSVVALSLSVLALCALIRTVSYWHQHEDHGKWGHERMSESRRGKPMGMMNFPISRDMDDDMNEDELPARHSLKNPPDKK